MEFGEYLQRIKEIEKSGRSDSAKKADVRQLQGRWQEEVKKKKNEVKRNDMSHVRKSVDARINMNKEILEQKWNQ